MEIFSKRIVAVSATYVLDKRSVKYYTKKSVKSNIYTKAQEDVIMKKRFAAAACLIAAALSLSACGGSGQTETTAGGAAESTTAAPAAGAPAGGKVVRVAAVDPQVALDPQQYTYSIVMKITDNVTESLITTMEDGSLEPNLLTALPEVSEDGMTYSFELLPDVKFHNGETLKASDVKYSFERLVKLTKMATLMENVEGYKELADGAAEEMSGIQVQDDTHFTIKLVKPYAPFASVLSTAYCAVYPEAACEEAGDTWGMQVLYGTGRFQDGQLSERRRRCTVKI